jgi:hypothetical protein
MTDRRGDYDRAPTWISAHDAGNCGRLGRKRRKVRVVDSPGSPLKPRGPSPAMALVRQWNRPERQLTFTPIGPVAQRLEQQTHNLLVPGSNPGGPTTCRTVRSGDVALDSHAGAGAELCAAERRRRRGRGHGRLDSNSDVGSSLSYCTLHDIALPIWRITSACVPKPFLLANRVRRALLYLRTPQR